MSWYWWVVLALVAVYAVGTVWLLLVAKILGDKLDAESVKTALRWPLFFLRR